MPREIRGWKFVGRYKDAYEEWQAIRIYTNIYDKRDVKVHQMVNQYGQPYTDIYIRKGAKQIRKIATRFGSAMSFENI